MTHPMSNPVSVGDDLVERLRCMHRRAQKAEGAVQAALNQLALSEQFWLRNGLDKTGLHRKTIDLTRKALHRAALNPKAPS